jgi:hypothetical protein
LFFADYFKYILSIINNVKKYLLDDVDHDEGGDGDDEDGGDDEEELTMDMIFT